jgi:hypothetical protein
VNKEKLLLILRMAKARLEEPDAWCQGAMARSPQKGCAWPGELRSANSTDPDATQWCARGAVRRELNDAGPCDRHLAQEPEVLVELAKTLGDDAAKLGACYASDVCRDTVTRWNDESGRTLPEVLTMFQKTINRIEAS